MIEQGYDVNHFQYLSCFYRNKNKYALVKIPNEPKYFRGIRFKVNQYYVVKAEDAINPHRQMKFHKLFTDPFVNKRIVIKTYLKRTHQLLPDQIIKKRRALGLSSLEVANLLHIDYRLYLSIEQNNLYALLYCQNKLKVLFDSKLIHALIKQKQSWNQYQAYRKNEANGNVSQMQTTCLLSTGRIVTSNTYHLTKYFLRCFNLMYHHQMMHSLKQKHIRKLDLLRHFEYSLKNKEKLQKYIRKNRKAEWYAPLYNGQPPCYYKGVVRKPCTLLSDKYNHSALWFYLSLANFRGQDKYNINNYNFPKIPCVIPVQNTDKLYQLKLKQIMKKILNKENWLIKLKGQTLPIPAELQNQFTNAHYNLMIKVERIEML